MKHSRGQTLVLVALSLVVLLGMAALALDGGNVYLQRRQMQTAADAAALAAARSRCLNEADWVQKGNDYCVANGADNTGTNPCNVVAGSTDRSAQATASKRVQTWFAGILGSQFGTMDVRARAEANCANVGGAKNLLPLAVSIPYGGFFEEVTYELFDKESSDWKADCCADPPLDPPPSQCDDQSGAFGWIDWNSPKWIEDNPDRVPPKCTLKDSVTDVEDCSIPIYVGDWVYTDDGTVTSAQFAMEEWCGQHVTVPIYDERDPPLCSSGTGANTKYHVVGFAEFLLTSVCATPNSADMCGVYTGKWCDSDTKFRIEGEFIRWLDPDSIGDPSAPDIGVYIVHLAE